MTRRDHANDVTGENLDACTLVDVSEKVIGYRYICLSLLNIIS